MDYRPNTPAEKFQAFLVTSGIAAIMLTAIVAACAFFAGCAVVPPPVVTPVPTTPPIETVRVAVTVLDQQRAAVPGLSCELALDDGSRFPCDYNGVQAVFQLPRDRMAWGGQLQLTAAGFSAHRARVVTAPDLPEVILAVSAPPLSRLRLEGRHGLVNEAGAKVPWTAVTGFRLVEQVAHGRAGEAAAFLDGIGPARGVRVLLMARWLFQLSPDEGLAALAATLDLAQQHGRYLEVTIFADTKSFPLADADYRRIADQVGAVCAAHVACGLVEIANEVWSQHSTQADALGDLAFLRSLRETVRRHGDIPVSLGSTHADQDESDRMRDGDYLTIHGARDDGDDGWRWVRHSNEQRALADRVERWAVNDEPRRDDLACGRQLGMGLLARLFSLGDTFHFAGGLQAQPPSGAEAQAFACRARGWAAVPDDWWGQYANAGFTTSPVKSFAGAVRIYASVNGGRAYVLVLGATASLRIDWNEGWQRELVLNEDGAQLYRVTR